jgi:hypothetical protein
VDPNRIACLVGEAHAIVTNSQPQLAGLTFEFLHVAFTSLGKALDRGEDSHRHLPVDAADIGTRVLRPVDFLRLYRRLLLALEIVRREAKLGENFFVRNFLSTTLLEPGFRLGDRLALVLALWFVVDWGIRNGACDGVEQTFEHADRCGHLVRGKVLDQFMGVLFVCRHNRAILHRDGSPKTSTK